MTRAPTHVLSHAQRAFKELLPQMAFILDNTLSEEEVQVRTLQHGQSLRSRVEELESQPS